MLAVLGVGMLTHARWAGEPVGYMLAFDNCALFMLYIVLSHRIAQDGGANGIERLAMSMLVAAIVAFPLGIGQALPALSSPRLLLAALAVGVSSSVIPYIADQLALARLSRATFTLLLSLLPAAATVIGLVVLAQIPKLAEVLGVALVIAGAALHQARPK